MEILKLDQFRKGTPFLRHTSKVIVVDRKGRYEARARTTSQSGIIAHTFIRFNDVTSCNDDVIAYIDDVTIYIDDVTTF